MISDKFLGLYLNGLKNKVEQLKTDLADANFDNLYDVGKLQGQVAGIEIAIALLHAAYEEQDK